MKTIMDQQQKWLLRKYHVLCGKLGMTDEEKKVLLSGYGVESSKDLNNDDLTNICFNLSKSLDPRLAELDMWRKRVFAAIGSYLKYIGKENNPDLIKGVSCRCTGYDSFNDIPVERLRNIYYAFVKKQRDFERTYHEMEDLLTNGNGKD
jgi:hypothetical protein